MLDFSDGIRMGPTEEKYQAWLKANQCGFVVSLNSGRYGRGTRHKATCQTIWFPLKIGRYEGRTGKVCCASAAEVEAWLRDHSEFRPLNECSKCLDSRRTKT